MKKLIFSLLSGLYLGLVFVKSEVISWYRIQEMFYFKSFHMFGTFGLAILTALLSLIIMKKMGFKNLYGEAVSVKPKPFQKGVIYGGLLFGFGWAFTGACPGPIYALIGTGEPSILFILFGVFTGVLLYGISKKKLPH